MVFDSARGVTVLFGGQNDRGNDGETWEWNGQEWTLRATSGPSPRSIRALAYDSARGVTVLFGGYSGGSEGHSDTWEWDGVAGIWELRAESGPSPRAAHSLAYDSARGVTILFGGWDGWLDGETWEWDGASWTLRSTEGPPPRYLHALTSDSARGVSVLFGGVDDAVNNETWDWDGALWTPRGTTGPSPRYDHTLAYDSARGVAVLFGGWGEDGQHGDTWELCADFPCEAVERFEVELKQARNRCRIRAKAFTTLPEGRFLTFCFGSNSTCQCQTVAVNELGLAVASCKARAGGDFKVCVQGCPDLCRTVSCRP